MENTSRRRRTASLRHRQEENEGRACTDQDRAGPSNVRAFLSQDTDAGGQGDSPAMIDTDDDRKLGTRRIRVNPYVKLRKRVK